MKGEVMGERRKGSTEKATHLHPEPLGKNFPFGIGEKFPPLLPLAAPAARFFKFEVLEIETEALDPNLKP